MPNIPSVSTTSTAMRISLGPTDGNPSREDLQNAFGKLLAQARSHKGYIAHAERYEFRMRDLNGEKVLELKERNWASKLKNSFSQNRRSQERRAALEAVKIANPYNLKNFSDLQRKLDSPDRHISGADVRGLAGELNYDGRTLAKIADKITDWILPQRSVGDPSSELKAAFAIGKGSGEVDETSGLFQASLPFARQADVPKMRSEDMIVLNFGRIKGSTGSGGHDADMSKEAEGTLQLKNAGFSVPDDDEGKFAGGRGTGAIEEAFKHLMNATGQDLDEAGVECARRNIVALLNPGMKDAWLSDVDARYAQVFGQHAFPDPDLPASVSARIRIDDEDDSFSMTVTIREGIKIGEAADKDPVARLEYEREYKIDLQLSDLAKKDFNLDEGLNVLKMETFSLPSA
jgi:hypothetical protein